MSTFKLCSDDVANPPSQNLSHNAGNDVKNRKVETLCLKYLSVFNWSIIPVKPITVKIRVSLVTNENMLQWV